MRDFKAGMKKYEYSLLMLCEQVHMASNGSGDDPTVGLKEAVDELENRLRNWHPNDSDYDENVRLMTLSAFKEGNRVLRLRRLSGQS